MSLTGSQFIATLSKEGQFAVKIGQYLVENKGADLAKASFMRARSAWTAARLQGALEGIAASAAEIGTTVETSAALAGSEVTLAEAILAAESAAGVEAGTTMAAALETAAAATATTATAVEATAATEAGLAAEAGLTAEATGAMTTVGETSLVTETGFFARSVATLGRIGSIVTTGEVAAPIAGGVIVTIGSLLVGAIVYVLASGAGFLASDSAVEKGPALTGNSQNSSSRNWRIKGDPIFSPYEQNKPWSKGQDYKYEFKCEQKGNGMSIQFKTTNVDRNTGKTIPNSSSSADFKAYAQVLKVPSNLSSNEFTKVTVKAEGKNLFGSRNEWAEGYLKGKGIVVRPVHENKRGFHVRGLDPNRQHDAVEYDLTIASTNESVREITLVMKGGGTLTWKYVDQ